MKSIVMLSIVWASIWQVAKAQQQTYTSLSPAVPALNFEPGTEGTAMAVGTAAGSDNSLFYNPSKFVLNKATRHLSIGYMPFYGNVIKDAHFTNIEYFTKLGKKDSYNVEGSGNGLGISLNYYTIGNVFFKDDYGNETAHTKPHDYSLGLTYIKYHADENIADNDKLPGSALAITFKLYVSTALRGIELESIGTGRSVMGIAGGISYFKQWFKKGSENRLGSFGLNIQNLGPKVNYYSNLSEKNYLPASLRVGYGESIKRPNGQLSWGIDLSKLLVPTPPIVDTLGKVTSGKTYDRGVVGSWFSSFMDAPGGIGEELKEFQVAIGTEYQFQNNLFIRGGISIQSKQKGNNSYVAVGGGYRINKFGNLFDINVGYRSALNALNAIRNQYFITLKFNYNESN